MIIPSRVATEQTVETECSISAYFPSYDPEFEDSANPWASSTFNLTIGYNLWMQDAYLEHSMLKSTTT